MKRCLSLLLFLGVLLLPRLAHAQTSTGLQVVISGGVSPVTNVLPLTAFQCGQPPIAQPTGTLQNPTGFGYIDPADAAKTCRYKDPGNGPLLSLPFGGTVYTATAAFVNAVGTGLVSNVSPPFNHPGAVPTLVPQGFQAVP